MDLYIYPKNSPIIFRVVFILSIKGILGTARLHSQTATIIDVVLSMKKGIVVATMPYRLKSKKRC
jgi:hypothetical protein